MRGFDQRRSRVLVFRKRIVDQSAESEIGIGLAIAPQLVTREGRALGRKRFPTLVTACRTNHRSALADRHVTKLARRARHSLIHLAVENDSCAQSFMDQ